MLMCKEHDNSSYSGMFQVSTIRILSNYKKIIKIIILSSIKNVYSINCVKAWADWEEISAHLIICQILNFSKYNIIMYYYFNVTEFFLTHFTIYKI